MRLLVKYITGYTAILTIMLTGCVNRIFTRDHLVSDEGREWMPVQIQHHVYVNQDKEVATFQHVHVKRWLDPVLWDTGEPNNEYYAYIERVSYDVIFDKFELTYVFTVDMCSPWGSEYLLINNRCNLTTGHIGQVNPAPLHHWEKSVFVDSLRVGDTTLYNLYGVTETCGLDTLYLQKGIGLAVFKKGGDTWVIR
jgi:hypothetical protein